MALARRLTSLGRAARGEAAVKVRQPLTRALVFLPAGSPEILRDIVADELNVDEVDTADELSEVIQFELVPNFQHPRRRAWGTGSRSSKPALAALDGAAAAAALEEGRSVTVTLGGRAGRAVARRRAAAGPRPAGLRRLPRGRRGGGARPRPRRRPAQAGAGPRGRPAVQDLRKASGLEVSDRIRLHVVGLDAIAEHFDFIAREVLAIEIVSRARRGGGHAARARRRAADTARAGVAAEGRVLIRLVRCSCSQSPAGCGHTSAMADSRLVPLRVE